MIAALRRAAAAVRCRTSLRPEIGIVLGSGMSEALSLPEAVNIPFVRIPGFPRGSVVGHAGVLSIGRFAGRVVAVMRGRVHYYEGHDPAAVIFPVRLLAQLGIRSLILTNAVGGIRRSLRPGALMIVRDHLNMMGFNPLRGPNLETLGPRFPDASRLYDAEWPRRAGLRLPTGIYAAVSGPSYETPAEIRALARLGADAVGMSLAPEALAAAHLRLRTTALSLVANRAAGLSARPLSHAEVLAASARALPTLRRALEKLVGSP